ncbi:MAG: glycosyltransferase [Treponema sp.]|jgi:glycosyltransferase involved in cell wall biosynthesis|nr:glycosyltransferase [Treponema sp.]
MKISIVIPALNEEKTLPGMLDSIKAQDFEDYEIIVADAHSTDSTRDIAERYGCRVVDGGLPAAGRNAGAAAANGEYLFFFDADVILPPGFIRNVYEEMQDRFIDLATCEIRPLSDFRLDRVIHRMINLIVLLNLRIDPKAFGFCIFVTKRLFDRVGGFDETIYVAEDNDFVKRASVYRSLKFLNSAYIMVSIRRFEKEGRFAYMKKGIKLNLYRTFKGEIHNDEVVKYEFDAFENVDNKESISFLDKLEKQLLKIEKNSKAFHDNAKKKQSRDSVNINKLRPELHEYDHLVEKLDTYLTSKERSKKRHQKFKNFFKFGHSS